MKRTKGVPEGTRGEREAMLAFKREFRIALRTKRPIEIVIDPWADGCGAYLIAVRASVAARYSIENVRPRRRRGGRS